ncbi:MAG TPA: hypothetical protein VNV86_02170 [Candidatus Acidoferrum sp.]|nr:hypothetical protein [Candidatus Acidoferrum sp.]
MKRPCNLTAPLSFASAIFASSTVSTVGSHTPSSTFEIATATRPLSA